MRSLNKQSAAALLMSQGVKDQGEIAKILDGFDLGKPLYEHDFWPDDVVYQLVRLPSASLPAPTTGNWFGLAGITTQGVAINEGLAGRRLMQLKVIAHFKALEGTAKRLATNLLTGIGGPGGATQIYAPRSILGHLAAIAPAERW